MEASALPASAGLRRSRIAIGVSLLRLRTDEQLVKLFRDGNEAAFEVIDGRYRHRLELYARRMLGPGRDSEAAVQDILTKAYQNLRAHNRHLALRAWLFKIAHNRCIDELRRPYPVAVEPIDALIPSGEDPVARAEERAALSEIVADIRRLPDEQRSALVAVELCDFSYAEVASALDKTEGAVKSLLVRSRETLTYASMARNTACAQIRDDLIRSHVDGKKPSKLASMHMRDCSECRRFRAEMRSVNHSLAALAPTLGPLAVIANLLGFGGGGAAASGGAAGTGAAAGAAGTGAAASTGLLAGSATHVVTLLAAAVVTAGSAVELHNTLAAPAHHRVHHHAVAIAPKRAPQVRPAATGLAAVVPHNTPQSSSSAASVIGGAIVSRPKTSGKPAAPVTKSHATHTSATNQTPLTMTLDPDNLIYANDGPQSGTSNAAASGIGGRTIGMGTNGAGTTTPPNSGTTPPSSSVNTGSTVTSGPGNTGSTATGTNGSTGTTSNPSSSTGTQSSTTPTGSSVGSTGSSSPTTGNGTPPAATSNTSSPAPANASSTTNTSGSSPSTGAASKSVSSSASSTNLDKVLKFVTTKRRPRHRFIVGRLL